MRIETYNQVGQLYQATKPNKATKTGEAKPTERYEVSRSGQDYQTVRNALSEVPDIREDKVRKIKEALSSGSYNVSSQEIAESMVSKYFDSFS